jgi:hypothetical protein
MLYGVAWVRVAVPRTIRRRGDSRSEHVVIGKALRSRAETIGWALALGLVLSGCGAGSMQMGPNNTLRAYARALQDGRPDDAYRLLSGEAKKSISLEAFRQMVSDNGAEMRDIAETLARPTSDPVVTATATGPKGETVLLVYEGGQWRLDATSIELYGQASPRQAIQAFVRAFDQKRYDILLRFVPDGHRDDLSVDKLKAAWEGPQKEEMLRITAALKAALPTAKLEETGDRATMAYGNGGTVQLVREHSVWRIEDFD